ncbi:dihydrofolate synthase / folylpolyglutamate synthase [Ewingella americana]
MSEKVGVPQATSDLHDWLSYIDSLHSQVIDMSLNRIKAVANTLDVLKPAPFIFLVGGTNGKGTTCHTLEKTLQLSGYKVGVFSSPHMINYTETVRIQGKELAGSEHVAAFVAINHARQDTTLTPFEFNTLGAFWLMKQAQVDVAIIEVGMGGRDDATNIIEPDISVITNVALDHEDWLGKDTEAIGEIKAGIFRAGKPAIIGQASAPASLLAYAQKIGAVTHQRDANWQLDVEENKWSFSDAAGDLTDLAIPKMPLENVATAIAALRASGLNFTPAALQDVILHANLPGRFQIIGNNPTTILDVAHNPHAAAYLADRLRKFPIKGNYRFVIGMLINKDIKATVDHLKTLSDKWYCCGVQAGPRSTKPEDVAQYLPQAQKFADILAGWEAAKRDVEEGDVIVVCGSFFTVAPVLNALNSESE